MSCLTRRFGGFTPLVVLGLLMPACPLFALIGVPYQMQLGNPSNAAADTNNHDHYLIQRSVEALDYSDNLRQPNWASWDYTSADTGSSGRGNFAVCLNQAWCTTQE
jgi:endonuclease G